jgi:transcriptional regulator with XRE-family HTH domain
MQFAVHNTTPPPPYPGGVPPLDSGMDFAQRLVTLRKEKGFTQQHLAGRVSVHVQQLKRYEAGSSQPTLDVIRNLATALSVSADDLLFGRDQAGQVQRGPDDDLRLQFEAVSRFDADEKQVIRSLLDGMILKHEARRWSSPAAASTGAGERK